MNIEMLLEEFEKILLLEEEARDLYNQYIDKVDDANIKQQLISIRDDEIMHVKVANKLVEYVS